MKRCGPVLTVVLISARASETLADISVDMFLWYTPTKSFAKLVSSGGFLDVGSMAAASVSDNWK